MYTGHAHGGVDIAGGVRVGGVSVLCDSATRVTRGDTALASTQWQCLAVSHALATRGAHVWPPPEARRGPSAVSMA